MLSEYFRMSIDVVVEKDLALAVSLDTCL